MVSHLILKLRLLIISDIAIEKILNIIWRK